MNNFRKVIQYLSSFSSPLDRGRLFEQYCQWFLKNDSRYSMQLKKIWLWRDWPGNWGKDKGIDLVAETHSGEIWAIQAKAYDENYDITKKDIDKFLSESARPQISYRLLISTTNKIGFNAREVMDAQVIRVGICNLQNLETSALDWPLSINNLIPCIAKNPKKLRPHQEEALQNIEIGFKKSPYGKLLMACGTGKTIVGLRLSERLKCQSTLVLVPSISLVSQIYQEWSDNSDGFLSTFYPIFVCSDPTVNEKDQMVLSTSELGFPVTTNADEIIKALSLNSIPKVIFSTYHSSPEIAEACKLDSSINFDLTIADEAHRCTGSAKSDFTTIVNQDTIKTKRKLFMTATPKTFSDHVKTVAKEYEYEIFSMDDPEKFGPTFHKLSFSEAIKRDLLSDYQVLISVMDNEKYRQNVEEGNILFIDQELTDTRTLASQFLVAKAINKYGLKRVISFHSRTEAAQKFIETFPNVIPLLSKNKRPDIQFYGTIFGHMRQNERQNILKRFEESCGTSLLANVKCLSEGVDVPTLDAIAFIDPKESIIDIVQAVGRAIRKSDKNTKKISTIIVPVFIDKATDETQALEQSCFKSISNVVKALRTHDDILGEEIDNEKSQLGNKTSKNPAKLSKFIFEISTNQDPKEIEKAIMLKIMQDCSDPWSVQYKNLKEFRCLNSDRWPKDREEDSEESTLARWCTKQRQAFKKGKLAPEKKAQLDEINFEFDPLEATWKEMFAELLKFKDENGHCNVPRNYSKNPVLNAWITNLRVVYKKEKLRQDRIDRLNAIDFDWSPIDNSWQKMFDALLQYKEKFGNCNVPKDYIDNPSLGNWVDGQRQKNKKNKLSQNHKTKLNAIDFDWDPKNTYWQEMFDALCQYKKELDHCNVPSTYKHRELAHWVIHQRQLHKQGKLKQDRTEKLQQLGFIFEPDETAWEEKFTGLKEFFEKNNHSNVPQKHPILGAWVGTQRQQYRKGQLPQTRIQKLNELNFTWEFEDRKKSELVNWEDRFQELSKFKKINGHCNVPSTSSEKQSLAIWIVNQRKKYKIRKLTQDQIEKLSNLGLKWTFDEWSEKITVLKEHYQKNGTYKVSPSHSKILAHWIVKQRGKYKQGKLSEDQKKQLDELNFYIDPGKSAWEKKFKALCEYKKLHGDCNVPKEYDQNPSLGIWVDKQRQNYKSQKLSSDKIKKLNTIAFTWDPKSSYWQEMFDELYRYKKDFDNCNVPRSYLKNKQLAHWVNNQRAQYNKGKLSPKYKAKLDDIGFLFEPDKMTWENMFTWLKRYKEENGDCKVPQSFKQLGRWVTLQRQAYKNSALNKERTDRLNALGFTWKFDNIKKGDDLVSWGDRLASLREFQRLHGHHNVSNTDASLARWITKQRYKYKSGILPKEKIKQLDEIGFSWEPSKKSKVL